MICIKPYSAFAENKRPWGEIDAQRKIIGEANDRQHDGARRERLVIDCCR